MSLETVRLADFKKGRSVCNATKTSIYPSLLSVEQYFVHQEKGLEILYKKMRRYLRKYFSKLVDRYCKFSKMTFLFSSYVIDGRMIIGMSSEST